MELHKLNHCPERSIFCDACSLSATLPASSRLVLFRGEENESVESLVVTEVVVDDPVHQLEAGERDWKEDPAVLVDVRRSHPEQLAQVLRYRRLSCPGCRCGRRGGWRGRLGRWRRWWRWWRRLGRGWWGRWQQWLLKLLVVILGRVVMVVVVMVVLVPGGLRLHPEL